MFGGIFSYIKSLEKNKYRTAESFYQIGKARLFNIFNKYTYIYTGYKLACVGVTSTHAERNSINTMYICFPYMGVICV